MRIYVVGSIIFSVWKRNSLCHLLIQMSDMWMCQIVSVQFGCSSHPSFHVHLNGCALPYCIRWSSVTFFMFGFFLLLLRALLSSRCHGFTKAIVTQENTPVGAKLVYDGEKRKPLQVTSAIFHTFTKVSFLAICCFFILTELYTI